MLPVGPVLMIVKAVVREIPKICIEYCEGCLNNEEEHLDCVILPWEEKVDRYFEIALLRIGLENYMQYLTHVYHIDSMFEEDQYYCAEEAIGFFKTNLKDPRVQMHVQRKVLKK